MRDTVTGFDKVSITITLRTILFFIFTLSAGGQAPHDPIAGIAINPIKSQYALARDNGIVEVVDYQTHTIKNTYSISIPFQNSTSDTNDFAIGEIAYSPDGKRIAISVSDSDFMGLIYLINLETDQVDLAHNQPYIRRINDMSWSPDGTKLVLALQSGIADQLTLSSIEILNVFTGDFEAVLMSTSLVDKQIANAVDWGVSNIIAYSIGSDLVFWNTNTEEEIDFITLDHVAMDITWWHHANRLATLNSDRKIRIWDFELDTASLQNTFPIVSDNFRSRAMTWIDESRIAVNIWTNVEVWNVFESHLDALIETDHFIFGIVPIGNDRIIYAGPENVIYHDINSSLLACDMLIPIGASLR